MRTDILSGVDKKLSNSEYLPSCDATRDGIRLYLLIKSLATDGIVAERNVSTIANAVAAAEDHFSEMKQLPNEGIVEFIVRFRDSYKSVITAGGTVWCPSLLATRYMQKLSFARYRSMYADMMNAAKGSR